MRISLSLLSMAAALLGSSGAANAQSYHAIALKGASGTSHSPFLLSSCGNTLVYKFGGTAVYHDEVYRKLPKWLSAKSTIGIAIPDGYAVNNYGDVTGTYPGKCPSLYYCEQIPFVVVDGKHKDIASAPVNTQPMAINDQAVVVGQTTQYDPSTGVTTGPFPFIFDGERFQTMPTVGTIFQGINNNGQIVGSGGGRAFIYADGAYTDIPVSLVSGQVAINDAGDVVGDAWTAGGKAQGFIYSHGTVSFIGAGPAPYDGNNILLAINNQGQAVGSMASASNRSSAILYSNGVITDLNDISDAPVRLDTAIGISDAGEITAMSGGSLYLLVPNGQFPPDSCKTH